MGDGSDDVQYGPVEVEDVPEDEDDARISENSEALRRMREEEEKAKLEEEVKKSRPRWPPREKGVLPDIEVSMKEKIKKLARYVMKIVGIKGKKTEKEFMRSIAKGMIRDSLKIFEPPRKLLLNNLGRRALFREPDEFDDETSEDETVKDWGGEDEEGSIPDRESSDEEQLEEEEEKDEELLDFLYHPEKYDRFYKRDVFTKDVEEEDGKEVDEGEEMPDEDLGYPWEMFEDMFRTEGEEAGDDIRGKLARDLGFDFVKPETPKDELGQEEERKRKKFKRRRICRLTLVRCGNTPRQDLGYMDGWTDPGPEMGKPGRAAIEKASLALLERGYKFDMVIASTLSVARTTADMILFATGQDSLRRFTTPELNPRHFGDLEGQTLSGVSSAWGWLSPEFWSFRGPPLMKEHHKNWFHQANGEPTGDPQKPKGETMFHVIARLRILWNIIKNQFIFKGKRSILLVGHKDSLCALMFHLLQLHPTDFSHWEPASDAPMCFAFEVKEENFGLVAIDFITNLEESRNHVVGLCKAIMERHIDSGIIDKYAVKEIQTRFNENRLIPTLEDIYRYKRREAYTQFEGTAKQVGKKERRLDALEKMFADSLPKTDIQKFYDYFFELQKDSRGEMEFPVDKKVEWITRNVPGVQNKISRLKDILSSLPPNDEAGYGKMIEEVIASLKTKARAEKQWQKMHRIKKDAVDKNIEQYEGAEEKDTPPWKCLLESLKRGWLDDMSPDIVDRIINK